MDLLKITLSLRQHVVSLFQGPPHQLPGAGHGRVDDNGKILYPVNLSGLQRLNEGHIAVEGQAVGIERVVK